MDDLLNRIFAARPELLKLSDDELARLSAHVETMLPLKIRLSRVQQDKRAGLTTYQDELDAERRQRAHLKATVLYNRARPKDTAGNAGAGDNGQLVELATPQAGTPPESKAIDKTKPPPSRLKAAAVYEWAIEVIDGADTMSISDLHSAVFDKLDTKIAEALPGAGEVEKLQELRDSLPDNAETFGRYLREAGIRKYNAKGERARKTSHFPRSDQF